MRIPPTRPTLEHQRYAADEFRFLIEEGGRYDVGASNNASFLRMEADERFHAGDMRGAIQLFTEALNASKTVGDQYHEGWCLLSLGEVYRAISDTDSALQVFYRAVECWRSCGYRRGFGIASHYLAFTLADDNELGDSATLSHYNSALDVWREVEDPQWTMRTLNNVALFQADRGDLRGAVAALQICLLLSETSDETARLHTSLGSMYSRLGQYTKALTHLEQSLALREELEDASGQARTLQTLANTYLLIGQPEKAQPAMERSLRLDRNAPFSPSHWRALYSPAHAGATLLEEKTRLQELLGLCIVASNQDGKIECLIRLSDIAARLDKPREALLIADAAVADSRRAGKTYLELRALLMKAELLCKQGLLGPARELLHTILARSKDYPECAAEAHTLRANVHHASNRPLDSLSDFDAALKSYEKTRLNLNEDVDRAVYYSRSRKLLDEYLNALYEYYSSSRTCAFANAAFDVVERTSARNMLEVCRPDTAARIAPASSQEYQRLVDAMRQIHHSLVGTSAHDFDHLREVGSAIDDMERQSKDPGLAKDSVPRELMGTAAIENSPRRIQALLDPATLVLRFCVTTARTFVWVISQSAAVCHESVGERVLSPLCDQFVESIRNCSEDVRPLGSRLVKLLLGSVAETIAFMRAKSGLPIHLVIVPDGPLQVIPFECLSALCGASELQSRLGDREDGNWQVAMTNRGEISRSIGVVARQVAPETRESVCATRWLVDECDISYAPSSAVLESLLLRNERSAGMSYVGVAGTEFRGFETLRFTEREVRRCASLFSEAARRALIGSDSMRCVHEPDAIAGARYLHYATHGVTDAVLPSSCGIVVSDGVTDSMITATEIGRRSISAELVVLSACNTAVGRNIGGEGVLSLSRAFLLAGADSVCSTLWAVDDASTAVLVTYLFRQLVRGAVDRARALARAKRCVMRRTRWRHPYFWAAPVLYGRWQ